MNRTTLDILTRNNRFSSFQGFLTVLISLTLFCTGDLFGQCTIDAGVDVTICSGQSATLTSIPLAGCNGPFTYSWTSIPDGGPYPSTQSITVTPLVTTVFTVSVYDGASGPYTDDVTVIVNPLPNPSIAGPESPCKLSTGNVYTTDAGMLGYTWAVSPGATITSGGGATDPTVTVTWGNQGSEWVSVNYTNSDGCTASSPSLLPVTVLGPTISGPTSTCKLVPGYIYTTEAGKSGYTWVYAGASKTDGGNGFNYITLTWLATGSRSVKVTYTDGSCTSQTTLPVNVYPTTASILGPSNPCKNIPSTFITESGMSDYSWSVSPGGTINSGGGVNDPSVTITWSTTGSHWVQCSYSSPYGCTITPYTLNVNVLGPILSGGTDVCLASEHTYTTEPGMGNTYSWAVSGGTITSGGGSSNNTCNVTWTTPGQGSVTVGYTNASCTSSTTLPINVQSPTPSINGPNQSCTNATVNYSTDEGMTNYSWSTSGGGTIIGPSNASTVTVNWNTSGAQWVQVTYDSPYGCASSPATYNVTVWDPPVPSISGPSTPCKDTPGYVYTTEPGMSDYDWIVTAGNITAGAGTNSISVTWTSAGAQQVMVNYTDANGCQATVQSIYPVTVLGPIITGTTTVCKLSTHTYTTEPGMTNYVWTFNGASKTVGTGGSTQNFITLTWTATGNRWVRVAYTNGSCTASTTLPILVLNIAPTLTGPSASCINSINTYTTDEGMLPGSYIWTPPPGNTILSGGGINDHWITIQWDASGLQQPVTVTYTSPLGCTISPTTVKVDVWELPIPSLTGPAGPFCGASAGNTYTTEAGMKDYIWQVSSGNTITSGGGINDNTITIDWNSTGSQWVSVNYTDKHGAYYLCSATTPTVLPVTVIIPTITGPAEVCNLDTAVYSTEPGMGNTYVWSWNGAVKIAGGEATDNTVTLKWISPGSRWVKVTYTEGSCIESTTLPVTVHYSSPSIAGPSQSCIDGSGTYLTETGMSDYDWSVSPGGTINGSSNTPTVSVTWNETGTQWIKCNYSSPFCAITPTILYLTVWDLPVPGLTGPSDPFCPGATSTFTTEPGKFNYVWSVTPGNTYIGGGTTDNTISVTWGAGGAQSVSVSYTDVHNCQAASPAVFNLTVDDQPPTITSCPANISEQADPGENYATISVPPPVYSDNITPTGNITVTWIMSDPTAGTGTGIIPDPYQFNSGTTTVTYTFVDGCGNSNSCQFDVTVSPNNPPVISCSGNITLTTDPGLCSASLDPGFPSLNSGTQPVTYSWEMTGSTVASGTGPILPNPFTFNEGVTTIHWIATNAAGTDDCFQTVEITDDEQPVFTTPVLAAGYCVVDIQTAIYNPAGTYYVDDLSPVRPDYYTITSGNTLLDLTGLSDNCPGDIEIFWEIDFGDDGSAELSGPGQISASTPFDLPLGNNRIKWTVTDANGVTATADALFVVLPRPDIQN